ncbi:hypothetical protein HD806DRAFT_441969 [Xylariaceae sp. AK1471]|nr:hypothetical protein HD806DRAFT_441969 [Xylariaceae sp. AK1471]
MARWLTDICLAIADFLVGGCEGTRRFATEVDAALRIFKRLAGDNGRVSTVRIAYLAGDGVRNGRFLNEVGSYCHYGLDQEGSSHYTNKLGDLHIVGKFGEAGSVMHVESRFSYGYLGT